MNKVESCHVGRCYYIRRVVYNRDSIDMQGNYCPDTGEYYLSISGEVIASYWYDEDGYCHVDSSRGYSYEVVRELLRLGHLTSKTLASFIEAGGEVWWNQP